MLFFLGSHTTPQKNKSLRTALLISCSLIKFLDNIEKLGVNQPDTLIGQMGQIELELQTILKHLIQFSVHKQSHLKRIYMMTLQTSVQKDNLIQFCQHLRNILEIIQQDII